MNIAEAVGLVSVLTTGFLLVRADQVTVGAVTAAALLFHRLFGPLGTLLMSFNDIQSAGAALTRLVGVADLPVPPAGAPRDRPTSADLVARGGLAHLPRRASRCCTGWTCEVPAGQSLAVVGESGAGKTTLAAILGGVFPATGGTGRRSAAYASTSSTRCSCGSGSAWSPRRCTSSPDRSATTCCWSGRTPPTTSCTRR